jgi:glycosyltransferase involved in cell wall biosynthesis
MSFVSGVEFMTFEVLRALRARGTAVHCILNTWANWDRPQEKHPIAALAERIGASWSTGYYWYSFARRSRNPLKLAQLGWDILRTSGGLLRDAWYFRPSHVDVPDYLAVLRNAPALMLLRLVGCRVVFRLGNAPEPGSFYRRVWRWGVNPFVARFVCNSNFTETELLAHGIPPHKVSRIYNCAPFRFRLDSDLSGIRRDPHRIIYIGQIIPEKGLDLVLDALGILVSRGYDVGLDVVGDMEGWAPPAYVRHRETLVARAGLRDLAGRVRFLGWRADVPDLLARASLLCCPSRPELREGFGLVVVEAKLAGVPGIVCPTGALPELIEHGEDGWVASEVSAAALAGGLEYFLKDPVRLQRARHAARRSTERFSRDRFAEAWWAVFQEKRERRPSLPER